MSEDVRAVLSGYVAEAMELRLSGDRLPDAQLGAGVVLESLLQVRRRLDRVEQLLSWALQIRGRSQRKSAIAQATVDDAWDRAIQAARMAPVGRGDEYSSARERHADANLTVLDDRRAARVALELAHVCDETVDVLRLTHRGLDGVRQDHLAVLRALQFESTLDR